MFGEHQSKIIQTMESVRQCTDWLLSHVKAQGLVCFCSTDVKVKFMFRTVDSMYEW